MKDSNLPRLEGKHQDIFAIPGGDGMNTDVSDAAKILRSFVSQVGPVPVSAIDDAISDDSEVFLNPGSAAKQNLNQSEVNDQDIQELDQYIESVNKVSMHLEEEAPRIVPRIVSAPVDFVTQDLRLVYHGKATKRQLERLRKRVIQQAQSRSNLQAVPRSFEKG